MTHPVINNAQELQHYLETTRQWARKYNHRACIVIELTANAPEHLQLAQLRSALPEHFLWVNDGEVASDRVDQISARLGTETGLVAYNTTGGLAPDLIAATAASVYAGGLFLLLCPNLDKWGRSNPAQHNMKTAATAVTGPQSYFLQRFLRKLRQHAKNSPAGIRFVKLAGSFTDGSPPGNFEQRRDGLALFAAPPGRIHRAAERTQEEGFAIAPAAADNERRDITRDDKLPAWRDKQNQYLEQLTTFCTGEQACAVIINAARGRGKSALLGRLAAQLESQGESWQITSNRLAATTSVQRHWQLDRTGKTSSFPWLPVDKILRSQGKYLLVDEAADIPLASLQTMLDRYTHLIFATTSEGYEGAGRAFDLRFTAKLDRCRPGWVSINPQAPIRWSEGDALDALVADVLLLETQSQSVMPDDIIPLLAQNTQFVELEQKQLALDDKLLAKVFGLLSQTHYQTTSIDLQHLLDSHQLRIFIMQRAARILAVATIAIEGSIQAELHAAIVKKQRRLPDQLLPQLLAQCADQPDALESRYARIIRISVQPDCRRQGIGSDLLRKIQTTLKGQIDALGASFSADSSAQAFWSKNHYDTFHSGYRPNPRSGLVSSAVLKSFDSTVSAVLNCAIAIHLDNQQPTPHPLSKCDNKLLRLFANGQRNRHDTIGPLFRLWCREFQPAAVNHWQTMLDSELKLNSDSSERQRNFRWRAWVQQNISTTCLSNL